MSAMIPGNGLVALPGFSGVAGSGVIISAKGEALSNWHVIEKAAEIRDQIRAIESAALKYGAA